MRRLYLNLLEDRGLFANTNNFSFEIYNDLMNLHNVKVKLPYFSMICQTQIVDLTIKYNANYLSSKMGLSRCRHHTPQPIDLENYLE